MRISEDINTQDGVKPNLDLIKPNEVFEFLHSVDDIKTKVFNRFDFFEDRGGNCFTTFLDKESGRLVTINIVDEWHSTYLTFVINGFELDTLHGPIDQTIVSNDINDYFKEALIEYFDTAELNLYKNDTKLNTIKQSIMINNSIHDSDIYISRVNGDVIKVNGKCFDFKFKEVTLKVDEDAVKIVLSTTTGETKIIKNISIEEALKLNLRDLIMEELLGW